MAPQKTKKKAIQDALEDLKPEDFHKFCSALLDRREEPRVRRRQVDGKNFLEVTDVLVTTFTEDGAVGVALELLSQIDREVAKQLEEETGVQSSPPGSSAAAVSPEAESGGDTMAGGAQFVDKHRATLINRVNTISPILDELLGKNLQTESYADIRSKSTPQERMRVLFDCLNTPSKKEAFYNLLVKHDPFLVEDLKKEQ